MEFIYFWNRYTFNNKPSSKKFRLIKELSYIIEIDGDVVGAIFYTNSTITDKKGDRHNVISFGPVCISPKRQKHELQSYYNFRIYESYRFLSGKKYEICMGDMKFYKGVLVLPLFENALENIKRYVIFSKNLERKFSEEELEEFLYKEKKFQESQLEYEKFCSCSDK